MSQMKNPPAGCLLLIGILALAIGAALLAKAHKAASAHTVIHDAIKPAYYTPGQAYIFALLCLGIGGFAIVSLIARRFFKQ